MNDMELLELTGHDDLQLDDPNIGYVVQSGSLSLYMVELVNNKATGQRHYLTTCHQGSLIWGQVTQIGGHDLIMIAEPVEKASIEKVGPQAFDGPNGAQYSHALEAWCEKICNFIAKFRDHTFSEKALIDEEIEYSADQKFRPESSGFYRIDIEQGALSIAPGISQDITAADQSILFYSTGVMHFSVLEPLKAIIHPVEQARSEDVMGVRYLQDALLSLFFDQLRQSEMAERKRFQRLQKELKKEKKKAIDYLKLTGPAEWQAQEYEHDILSVLEVVGHYAKIDFNMESNFDVNGSMDDQIDKICRDSGVRYRHVRLIGEWWKDDIGQVLCFDNVSGKPMALVNLPIKGGLVRKYVLFDPETSEMIDFDPDMEIDLNENAFYFIRPMPLDKEEATSFFKLARFTYKPFTTDFILMFSLSFLSGVLGMFVPVANRLMIDKVIPDANKDLMIDLAVGMSCMSLGLFFFSLSQGLISLRIQTAMTAQLQSMIIDRLMKLPAKFYRQFSSGDLLNRAMMISEISAGFSNTVINAMFSLLSVMMMLLMCFYYSSKLAFLALIAAVLTSIFSISFSFVMRKLALNLERKSGDLFGFMVQMVNGVSKLQIAGAEAHAFAQWSKRYGEQLNGSYRIAQLGQYSSMINMFIQTFSTIALYYFAGTMIKESETLRALDPMAPALLTIGSFFAIQGAFSSVVGGIVGFFSSFITIHQQMAKRELARPILEAEVETGEGKKSPPPLEGLIEISNVSFSYGEDLPPILDKVNIKILPGQFVAFVGKSGCGKSTLFKLLLGFEVPESGQILYDKNDTGKLDMVGIRRQIGVVLQESSVSAGTIYHNIIGATKLTLEEAWEAAEDAGLADEIREMPMQLHTVVPEGGGTLSGGQKQRLMIARALAANPSIIFFDEATSALDNRTQKIVSDSLQRRKITRLVIAHRLSTVKDADKIVVLGEGKVLEEGTYEELVKQDGLFASMARRQSVTEEE
ncbi:NHLP bacteriocin export ABC transporter permease/ATPase subunit [Terasakiella sp.]|uniref:NHLP bacteriocin export ABC transporter permease/ATPase subunit n=1 Tax=Terasakiella sp. TaxID=2034861 RepID=UPI003AA8BC27